MGGWPAIRVSRFVSEFRAGRLWLASHPASREFVSEFRVGQLWLASHSASREFASSLGWDIVGWMAGWLADWLTG